MPDPRRRRDHRAEDARAGQAARLSVWLASRARTTSHSSPERAMAAAAAVAIAAYTRPGDLVLDPDCGSGTLLLEALRAGRHAVGQTRHPALWRRARARISLAKRRGAWPDGAVLDARRDAPATGVAGLRGRVGLVLLALPATPGDCPDSARLSETLRRCLPLLRPGAHVIVLAAPRREAEQLLDQPGRVLAAGRAAGLLPVRRCVALTSPPHGTGPADARRAGRMRRASGHLVPAHLDVLIFTAPEPATAAISLPARLPRTGSARRARLRHLGGLLPSRRPMAPVRQAGRFQRCA
ncbi:DNA methylase [Crossiella sp. SN42]|uniref:DNA methyltransferase n=1 Tax=Crossiella sp. SN42 TaxID=2944808 RepID=UPI00207C23D8|nr:DNA methyltransferase [Crossiella sp. SN42]MCO1575910.1 DNA methylase [Crossiella sp. SN42]